MRNMCQICRKTWVDQCAVKPGNFTQWDFYGFLFFYLLVTVKDIYRCKSGNIMRPNIHAFNHKLFHILTMLKYKVIQTGRSRLVCPDSSVYRASARGLNCMYRSLSFNCSSSPGVPVLSTTCVLPLYWFTTMLLLFIDNLKIATAWVDWSAIKGCNNCYLIT